MSINSNPTSTTYGTFSNENITANRKPMSLPRLMDMYQRGEKITALTAYDATFAAVADAAGIECILVGDSLGMVCQGLGSTVGVTLETMRYHVESVTRGLRRSHGTAWVIGDLPFGSYHVSKEQAFKSAATLMQAGAHMIKLEGGDWTTETVEFLVARGIPVCAHLGLTPQTVHALGGYRVQGKTMQEAAKMMADAIALQNAGATMMVLEMVPASLSCDITQALTNCPTIGIGAGKETAGQILVLHDMLGMNLGKMPKFVRNFMINENSIQNAIQTYVRAVKEGSFPINAEHAWD